MATRTPSHARPTRATRRFVTRLATGGHNISAATAREETALLDVAVGDRAAVVRAATDASARLGVSSDLILEAAAAYWGARDWNALSARLKKTNVVSLQEANSIGTRIDRYRQAIVSSLRSDPDILLLPTAWSIDDATRLREQMEKKSTTVVSGPTESGRRTTLQRAMKELAEGRGAPLPISIEDPPEWMPVHVPVRVDFTAVGWMLPSEMVEERWFDGTRFWFSVRNGRLVTNLPLHLVPAELASRCSNPGELALLAATLAIGGTLRQLNKKSWAWERLSKYAGRFALRFIGHHMPLYEGHNHSADVTELWSWLRHEGVWWWRCAEDDAGTEYA